MTPLLIADEAKRLAALRALDLLDTPAEAEFDRVTRLAAQFFQVPIVLVSLIDHDRQWFKSCFGMAAAETPRDVAFCNYTILSEALMIVPDATQDSRFRNNPFVTGDPHIRFYAGAPLVTSDGFAIGALCLVDYAPALRPERP